MSEKIFACLLLLYPARFREKYRADALQLYRDLCQYETGPIRRAYLFFELAIDALLGLRLAWRNSYAAATTLAYATPGTLTLGLLNVEPLPPNRIMLGAAASVSVFAAFALLMSLPHIIHSYAANETAASRNVLWHVHQLPATPSGPASADSTGNAIADTSAQLAPLAANAHANVPSRLTAPGNYDSQNIADSIAQLFDKHQIVIFGGFSSAPEQSQWLLALINTPAFAARVDDIALDTGNPRYQKIVDDYLAGRPTTADQLHKIWRTPSLSDAAPLYALQAIAERNSRNPNHQLRVILAGPRQSIFVHAIQRDVLAHHHRALLLTTTHPDDIAFAANIHHALASTGADTYQLFISTPATGILAQNSAH